MSDKNTIEMLKKALKVIDYISEKESVSFQNIITALGYSKATAYRILYTLEQENYLSKNPNTDEYALGMQFAFHGMKKRSQMTLTKICEPFLCDLANDIGESANLSLEYEHNVLNIVSIQGEGSVLTSKLIPISPLNCSASGKLFLAQKTPAEIKAYFSGNHHQIRTVNSISTYEDFLSEREEILKNNLSFDKEEYEYGLFCIAKKLSPHAGHTPACISISGPRTRMELKGMSRLIGQLTDTTHKIDNILINIMNDKW